MDDSMKKKLDQLKKSGIGLSSGGKAIFTRQQDVTPQLGSGFGNLSSGTGLGELSGGTGLGEQSKGTGFGDFGKGSGFGDFGKGSGFGDFGQASGFGDFGQGSGFGDFGKGSGFGDFGQASGFGDFGQASGFGDFGQASGFGDQSKGTDFGIISKGSVFGTQSQGIGFGDFNKPPMEDDVPQLPDCDEISDLSPRLDFNEYRPDPIVYNNPKDESGSGNFHHGDSISAITNKLNLEGTAVTTGFWDYSGDKNSTTSSNKFEIGNKKNEDDISIKNTKQRQPGATFNKSDVLNIRNQQTVEKGTPFNVKQNNDLNDLRNRGVLANKKKNFDVDINELGGENFTSQHLQDIQKMNPHFFNDVTPPKEESLFSNPLMVPAASKINKLRDRNVKKEDTQMDRTVDNASNTTPERPKIFEYQYKPEFELPKTDTHVNAFGLSKEEQLAIMEGAGLEKLNTQITEIIFDPVNRYSSGVEFSDMHLPNPVSKALEEMGFFWASKIQEASLPLILKNPRRNFVAQSQNGTGKTIAFLLGVILSIDYSKKHPQALILVPTYELALQTSDVLSKIVKYAPFVDSVLAVKDQGIKRNPIHERIIIGTPGTVFNWLTKYACFDGKKITLFVLDEADVMLADYGHQETVLRVRKAINPLAQHLLFSATYPANVILFIHLTVRYPIVVQLKAEKITLDNVKQYFVFAPTQKQQIQFLFSLFSSTLITQCIIFCKTRETTHEICRLFKELRFPVAAIAGDMPVEARTLAISLFKQHKYKILIATNVIARGLDIRGVSHVICFDIPEKQSPKKEPELDHETYLHRVGRAGRFGAPGVSISIVQNETEMGQIKLIEEYFKHPIEPIRSLNILGINKTTP